MLQFELLYWFVLKLIDSSVIAKLLLIPANEFIILNIIIFNSKISIWFFFTVFTSLLKLPISLPIISIL